MTPRGLTRGDSRECECNIHVQRRLTVPWTGDDFRTFGYSSRVTSQAETRRVMRIVA